MQTLFTSTLFGTLISFSSQRFHIIFKCRFCRSRLFTLQHNNPTMGIYCSGCHYFHPINSPDIIFTKVNFSSVDYFTNRKNYIKKNQKEFFNE